MTTDTLERETTQPSRPSPVPSFRSISKNVTENFTNTLQNHVSALAFACKQACGDRGQTTSFSSIQDGCQQIAALPHLSVEQRLHLQAGYYTTALAFVLQTTNAATVEQYLQHNDAFANFGTAPALTKEVLRSSLYILQRLSTVSNAGLQSDRFLERFLSGIEVDFKERGLEFFPEALSATLAYGGLKMQADLQDGRTRVEANRFYSVVAEIAGLSKLHTQMRDTLLLSSTDPADQDRVALIKTYLQRFPATAAEARDSGGEYASLEEIKAVIQRSLDRIVAASTEDRVGTSTEDRPSLEFRLESRAKGPASISDKAIKRAEGGEIDTASAIESIPDTYGFRIVVEKPLLPPNSHDEAHFLRLIGSTLQEVIADEDSARAPFLHVKRKIDHLSRNSHRYQSTGYRALHLYLETNDGTLDDGTPKNRTFEVQLVSAAAHLNHTYGRAAHGIYKHGRDASEPFKALLQRLIGHFGHGNQASLAEVAEVLYEKDQALGERQQSTTEQEGPEFKPSNSSNNVSQEEIFTLERHFNEAIRIAYYFLEKYPEKLPYFAGMELSEQDRHDLLLKLEKSTETNRELRATNILRDSVAIQTAILTFLVPVARYFNGDLEAMAAVVSSVPKFKNFHMSTATRERLADSVKLIELIKSLDIHHKDTPPLLIKYARNHLNIEAVIGAIVYAHVHLQIIRDKYVNLAGGVDQFTTAPTLSEDETTVLNLCKKLFAPLAEAFSMGRIYGEITDTFLLLKNPARYKEIEKHRQNHPQTDGQAKEVLARTGISLTPLDDHEVFLGETLSNILDRQVRIESRVKTIASMARKADSGDIKNGTSIQEMDDISGLCVVVEKLPGESEKDLQNLLVAVGEVLCLHQMAEGDITDSALVQQLYKKFCASNTDNETINIPDPQETLDLEAVLTSQDQTRDIYHKAKDIRERLNTLKERLGDDFYAPEISEIRDKISVRKGKQPPTIQIKMFMDAKGVTLEDGTRRKGEVQLHTEESYYTHYYDIEQAHVIYRHGALFDDSKIDLVILMHRMNGQEASTLEDNAYTLAILECMETGRRVMISIPISPDEARLKNIKDALSELSVAEKLKRDTEIQRHQHSIDPKRLETLQVWAAERQPDPKKIAPWFPVERRNTTKESNVNAKISIDQPIMIRPSVFKALFHQDDNDRLLEELAEASKAKGTSSCQGARTYGSDVFRNAKLQGTLLSKERAA